MPLIPRIPTPSRSCEAWGEIKPEVSAPGVQIWSSMPGGTYGGANGTSMAAPHVTGLVALMLQAAPTLSVDSIEAILASTANLLVWTGILGVGEAATITFPLTISPTIEGSYVYNRASLTDGWGDTVPLEAHTVVETRLYLPLIVRRFQ